MKIKGLSLLFVLLCAGTANFSAQNNDPFNSARGTVNSGDKDAFNRNRANNFNDYRTSLNAEYAGKLREKWRGYEQRPGEDAPADDRLPVTPKPWNGKDDREDRVIKIQEVIRPVKDDKKTAPIAPVKIDPDIPTEYCEFSFMGTDMKVRIPEGERFRVNGVGESAISKAWETLSAPPYAALVADCQRLKSEYRLCDWAYLNMLYALSNQYASGENAATLLTAYLFSQSGYKLRIGENNGLLDLLYASKHIIYNKNRFEIDGEYYYPFKGVSSNLYISGASFPKEQSLSLWISGAQKFDLSKTPERWLKSTRYPEMHFSSNVNKNLIDFYETYPTSMVGGNMMTRWAMYANTPISEEVRTSFYPQLKSAISGLDELAAVQKLLNWVQTAFVYEYDDKVWGHDRAFFPEETLYYPYCDCEDRSILLTRLVRDLLGLKCLLVCYPGHLAAAVAFNGDVGGDYILHKQKRYVITDPTYIGAPVGRTMPDMDNSSAKVILLD